MNPELTEEEMRRAMFGADEPVVQDNAPPVQKPLTDMESRPSRRFGDQMNVFLRSS
jgi:hypothetical protein